MNENLNELFANAGNETPINAPDNNNDGAITIEIVNSANTLSGKFGVYPENTLADVLECCGKALALASSGQQVNFECNGKTFSDPSLTVTEIGLVDGSKLLIHPNGTVAAEFTN